jgi:hypothetical protein
MVSDELFERVTQMVMKLTDEIGNLDPSVEGYLDLLTHAQEEIQVNIDAAKCDLDDEWEDLG